MGSSAAGGRDSPTHEHAERVGMSIVSIGKQAQYARIPACPRGTGAPPSLSPPLWLIQYSHRCESFHPPSAFIFPSAPASRLHPDQRRKGLWGSVVFALPRCKQAQPMASKAWLGPGVIHLGSERHFLALPWLFLLAREEVGAPHTQISSLGLGPTCQNPAQGSPHLPIPVNREQNSPPSSRKPANPILRG